MKENLPSNSLEGQSLVLKKGTTLTGVHKIVWDVWKQLIEFEQEHLKKFPKDLLTNDVEEVSDKYKWLI